MPVIKGSPPGLLAKILTRFLARFLTRVFGIRKYSVQVYWDGEIQFYRSTGTTIFRENRKFQSSFFFVCLAQTLITGGGLLTGARG